MKASVHDCIDTPIRMRILGAVISRTVLVVAVIALFHACTSEEVSLKLNVHQGQRFTYHTSARQEITVGKMTYKENRGYNYTIEVLNVSPQGILHLRNTMSGVTYSITSPNGGLTYPAPNTDHKYSSLDSLTIKVLKTMEGKSFDLYVSASGEVKSVKGIEKVVESVGTELGGGSDSAKQAIMQMAQGVINQMVNAKELSNIWNFMPGRPISEGDTWKRESTTQMLTPIQIKTQYEAEDINDDSVVISLQADIASVKDENPVMGEYNLEGTQKGRTVIEQSSGMLYSYKVNQEISGNASMPERHYNEAIKIISEVTVSRKP
ncbi:MAG: DUF6263 family protein [Bacteroidota bacterium]|nr:DUF6263 family protein [Bacteroidota bacterium]